jgi:hypothetical protein
MHTTPDSEDLPDEEPALGEEEFGDTELDRDDTHGVADDAAEAGESS